MTAVSCLQLPVSTPPKKRRHWSLGSFCSTLQFPLFPAGPALEGDLCLQSGDLSGMPVFPEPNLSSGYHTDDNQTAAERIKVVRPIRGSQTPLALMLNWINSQGPLQGQRTWMYSIKTTWLILCRSSLCCPSETARTHFQMETGAVGVFVHSRVGHGVLPVQIVAAQSKWDLGNLKGFLISFLSNFWEVAGLHCPAEVGWRLEVHLVGNKA